MKSHNLYEIDELKSGHHVALMYRSEDEHRSAIIPFLRKGLELGERVLYIIDSHTPETIIDYMRNDGVAIEQYLASGQFNIINSDDAYMSNGSFNPHRVIDTLWDERGRAITKGFPSLRITSEMSWVTRNPEHYEQFVTYEAELNRFFPSRPGYGNCLAICQYHLDRFPAEMMLKILATHPLVITGKKLCDNQHYLPPDDFFSPQNAARTLHQQLTCLYEQRTEQARLQKSEEQYRSVYDNSPYGLLSYDLNGKLLSVNRTCLEIFGVNDIAIIEGFNLLENFKLTNKVLEKSGDGQTVRFETTIDFSRMNFLNLVDSRKSGTMYLDVMVTEISPGMRGFTGGFLVCIQDITRRKKNEQVLKKSEDRFRSVIEVASDAIISCDDTGKIISWNNGAEIMFSYTADEMTGEPVGRLIGKEYRKTVESSIKRLVATGKAREGGENSIECSCIGKSRLEFPGEITLSRWKAGSGDFCTIIIRDISERKKTEAELRLKESAISASINPIALLDLQSNVTWVNKSFIDTWGYNDSAEIIGRPATSFWQAPSTATRIIAASPGKGWVGELQAKKRDGSAFPVQLSSTIISDPNNRPGHVIAFFVDLSSVTGPRAAAPDEVQAARASGLEVQLKEKARQTSCLSALAEIVKKGGEPSSVWPAIAEKVVEMVRYPENAGACVRIGTGEYRTGRFGSYPWTIAGSIYYDGRETGRIEVSYNKRLPDRDNGPFSHAECQALSIAASIASGFQTGGHTPPTMPESSEDAARDETAKRIDAMLSMTREIKTGLTPILSSSDLLVSQLEKEPWKEMALSINRGSIRLNQKLDTMLDVARIEAGTLPMEYIQISLTDLIAEIAQTMTPVLSGYRQKLVTDVPGKLPEIYGDRKRLRQVILSFLETAAKITPERKTITISVRKRNRHLEIEVRDPSPGLTDEQVGLLEQSEPATVGNEPLSGLGFGLALSRKLIELHHGAMWIRNVPGKGNTFGFSLPFNK